MKEDQIDEAVRMIQESRYIIAFTGAGISTESGIPDFRSPGGLWSKYDPEIYASWQNFLNDPSKYWTMSKELTKILLNVEPNAAHHALVKLEKMGKLFAVITQNIDNLHYRAGNKRIYELHGNYRTVHCMECNKEYSREEILPRLEKGEIPPVCSCGGVLRSDAILFGQPLPQDVFESAFEESMKSDLFIVIGSSLSVYPAASLPMTAKRNGSKLMIINRDFTAQDDQADLSINSSAAEVLTSIIKRINSAL
ncbi:MAG: SIR2 family NAD-dependent protein deacylase [Candidatus Hodarchaeales archaeon]